MTDLTPETLAELRRLAESATPGPWASGDPSFGEGNAQCIVSISERAMGRDIQGPNLHPALFDVEFIAAANPAVMLTLLDAAAERDALPALLAEAWDQGYVADAIDTAQRIVTPNPYRTEGDAR